MIQMRYNIYNIAYCKLSWLAKNGNQNTTLKSNYTTETMSEINGTEEISEGDLK